MSSAKFKSQACRVNPETKGGDKTKSAEDYYSLKVVLISTMKSL